MRVLVTGGSSLLARRTAEQLLARGDDITLLQRHAVAFDVAQVLGDVRDKAVVDRAVGSCDAVIHCAAKVGVVGSWSEYRSINVGGTENVVTFVVDRWFAGSDLAAAASRPAQQEPETATVTFLQGLDMPEFGSAETRMLVAGGMDTTDAGTELVGWGCGATRAWSADAEADWLETFG